MKNLMKLLMVAFVFTTATESFAQTTKGSFVLSGGTGLQFTSSKVKSVYDGETQGEGTISTFSFVPTFGYFVIDNLAVGLTSTITSSTQKEEGGDKYVTSSTMILPTALYYFPMEGKLRPIVQVGIGFTSQADKYVPKSGSDDKTTSSGLAINFGGGVSYFIRENISLNFGLSYTKVTLTDGDDDKSKMKQGNFGSNIGLAIYF